MPIHPTPDPGTSHTFQHRLKHLAPLHNPATTSVTACEAALVDLCVIPPLSLSVTAPPLTVWKFAVTPKGSRVRRFECTSSRSWRGKSSTLSELPTAGIFAERGVMKGRQLACEEVAAVRALVGAAAGKWGGTSRAQSVVFGPRGFKEAAGVVSFYFYYCLLNLQRQERKWECW